MTDGFSERVKCCVVGGGPAGVMVGALLARAGVRTLVLEKHGDFLRDFRGDTVHPSTLAVLDELGWLPDFLRLPHQELRRIRAHLPDAEITLADFTHVPARSKFIALMPQWDFLKFVVERANDFPAFEIRMRAEATGVVETGGRVEGVTVRCAGKDMTIGADLIIAADGRHSVLRKSARMTVEDVGAPIDVLWLRLPRRAQDPVQSLGWVTRGKFLALIDRGEFWQIACVIPKNGFDEVSEKGIEAFRASISETVPFLADRVGALQSFDDVKLLSVTVDRLKQWWRPGLLCIGDAAHAMSPVGGVGINLAIQDAVAAANVLAKPLRCGVAVDERLRRVQRRREWPTRATQAVQVAVQERVIQRALRDDRALQAGPVLRLLDRVPSLQRIPAYLVGIGVRPEHVRSPGAPSV
ncbi:MAG TPA: FAD-dependent oxidoreductase [Polyangiaceae bacterium]|nr:FAD-dependent oxidoreductase [Polyangiaceae bacterium]